MATVLINNGDTTSALVMYSANVADLDAVTLYVDDIGGANTITVETSADNSAWGSFTGGFSIANGVSTALGVATLTAKGIYHFPADANYIRFRVSTYASGTIKYRVEDSVVSPRSIVSTLQTGLIATGSTQATAYVLFADSNVFATVAASTGAILPSRQAGAEMTIRNGGASSLTVYPPLGGRINGGTINAGVALAAAANIRYKVDPANPANWWVV